MNAENNTSGVSVKERLRETKRKRTVYGMGKGLVGEGCRVVKREKKTEKKRVGVRQRFSTRLSLPYRR